MISRYINKHMDFLDPKKSRAHQIRLMIGYVLMAIAIGLATVVLVYSAYGYGVNTKTGNVIANGLLFVDSSPSGASIYLNGASQNSSTSARLVLPAGDYSLALKKSGYRDWQRKVALSEHTIDRFVYPFLFPAKLVTANLKTYTSQLALISQTPDRHWLLVQIPGTDPGTVSFDQYDTTKLTQDSTTISLPSSLLTNADQSGSALSEVEWSTDNVHLLLLHTYQGGQEFIVLDRQNPDKSFNVNKMFNVMPTQVALHNKKVDQLYIYQQDGGTLRIGDTSKGTLDAPILQNILAFKAYGSNLLAYITSAGAPAGEVTARIWDSGKTYLLYTFTAGDHYLIDAAQFQGHWYYVAGSSGTDRVNVYEDPLDQLKNQSVGKASPLVSLRQQGCTDVLFSDNTRFIEVQSGQSLAVYDLEQQDYYHYTLKAPLDGPLHWMDGHRLIGSSQGTVFVMDYDSTNQQLLLPTLLATGGDFDRDYHHLFTFTPTTSGASISLQSTDMRAGSDAPKNTLQN